MPRSKHPASAMFLGAVASTGEVSPPIWFPTGFRLGADAYIDALRKTIVPWMRRVVQAHGGVPYVFQQDSAPAHRARKTLQFLEEEGIRYWSPQQWPPNSPDLNPLDYAVWSMVVQGSCKDQPPSVTALKKRVSTYWRRMAGEQIRAVCRRFRPRLEKYIAAKGSYFDLKIIILKKNLIFSKKNIKFYVIPKFHLLTSFFSDARTYLV